MHFAMTFFTARGTSGIQVLSVTHMSELPPKIMKALIERSFQDDPVRNVVRSQRSGFTRLAFISYFVDVDRFFSNQFMVLNFLKVVKLYSVSVLIPSVFFCIHLQYTMLTGKHTRSNQRTKSLFRSIACCVSHIHCEFEGKNPTI